VVREPSGDPVTERLVELMCAYEAPLYAFAMVLLGDHDLAEECVQETFVRAYDHLRRGRELKRGWLYAVARNRARDELRRRRRVRTGMPADAVAGSDTSLRLAFASLPSDDRALLYLYAVEGLSADEIAALLGVRRSAVYMRVKRARTRLRGLLGDDRGS
jgi:RNA polymerase sigma-70 factor, ECF subfamily